MKHIKRTSHGGAMADVCRGHIRSFSRVTIKRAYIQAMTGIKKKCSMFCSKKANFSLEKQKILELSNKSFWKIWCQAHPQQRTALLLAPSVRNVKPDRCILSLYVCISLYILYFPINHSIHPLQPINIPSEYRFSFCLANLFKVDHN